MTWTEYSVLNTSQHIPARDNEKPLPFALQLTNKDEINERYQISDSKY